MLGRDAHIISNLSWNLCAAISYVNSSVPLSTTLLNRECICETMNPGPFLIIRNTFPITFIHFLLFKNPKIQKHFYILHSQYKTQQYHPSLFRPSLHIYLPSLHIYLLFCICFILISFSHLVLDNNLVRLWAENNLLCL